MKAIEIKDLTFSYKDKIVFNKFNLNIEPGKFTNIIGLNGSGKSTLIKLIIGLLESKNQIIINGKIATNIKEIRKDIGVVFENPDNQFVAETVMDDIAFTLENLRYEPKEIKKKVMEISKFIGISELLNKEPHSLSGGEKQLVALASALVHKPKILILDEALTMIDIITREKIYKILEEIKRDTTVINITHDMNELTYGDDIILIDNGNIILKGPKEQVLLEEKIFNKLNLELPFITSLSIKLMYYGLIDHLYFDMEELVNEIWK